MWKKYLRSEFKTFLTSHTSSVCLVCLIFACYCLDVCVEHWTSVNIKDRLWLKQISDQIWTFETTWPSSGCCHVTCVRIQQQQHGQCSPSVRGWRGWSTERCRCLCRSSACLWLCAPLRLTSWTTKPVWGECLTELEVWAAEGWVQAGFELLPAPTRTRLQVPAAQCLRC